MYAEKFDSYEEVHIDIDENGRIDVFDITRALHYIKHMLLAANRDSFEPFTLGLAFERHDDKLGKIVALEEVNDSLREQIKQLHKEVAHLNTTCLPDEEFPF